MALNLGSSASLSLMDMPLEIRRNIYRFCIPQNLCFELSSNMKYQNRPKGWYPFLSSDFDCVSEESGSPTTAEDEYPPSDADIAEDSLSDGGHQPFELGDYPRSELDDYPPSELDDYPPSDLEGYQHSDLNDYCQQSNRYRPKIRTTYRSALPGLLLICRQITDEVEAMLYGGNTFRMTIKPENPPFAPPEIKFRRHPIQKLRKIIIVLKPPTNGQSSRLSMHPDIWDLVLADLSILGIIAKQPEPETPHNLPGEEQKDILGEWTSLLTPALTYLLRTLSEKTTVIVDANKKEQTIKLFEDIMPRRCQFQRLRAADYIFQRGEFLSTSDMYGNNWYDDYDDSTSCRDIIDDCDYDLYYSD